MSFSRAKSSGDIPKQSAFASTLSAFVNPNIWLSNFTLVFLCLKQNAFAAPVVRHQVERSHTVIDRGVYGVVRHPMYAGAALLMVGMALWLESYAAAVLSIFPIALLAVLFYPVHAA